MLIATAELREVLRSGVLSHWGTFSVQVMAAK